MEWEAFSHTFCFYVKSICSAWVYVGEIDGECRSKIIIASKAKYWACLLEDLDILELHWVVLSPNPVSL